MIPKEYQEYLKYGMYGGAGLALAVEFQNLKLGNLYNKTRHSYICSFWPVKRLDRIS